MSLKKIAEMTGTSVSTVSKVLNGTCRTAASKELQDRIFEAAHQLNYVPDTNARNLKKGLPAEKKPLKVLIVLSRVESLEKDLFFKELYRYLEIELFRQGLLLDHVVSAGSIQMEDLKRCHGAIVLGRCSEKKLKTFQAYNSNLVGIWRNPMDFEIDEVVCDGRKAAEAAVMYLRSLGHREIGYIGDCSYESRYVGYTEAMIHEHLAFNFHHIASTNQSREQGALAMERLLSDEDLTAVLCANDMTALGVLDVLKARQRRSRRRISVISIDDIEEAQLTKPLLTTIRIPREDMAHLAVSMLKDRIGGGHASRLRIEFPCSLVVRESCYKI